MKDEPDIIRDSKDEESEFNEIELKSQYAEPQKYKPIEPDYGVNLRKAFAIVVLIILIVAGILFYISAAYREPNWILKAEQDKFIGTWEVEDAYYNHNSYSRTTWDFYENKTLKTTTYYNYEYNFNSLDTSKITFKEDMLNDTLTVTNTTEGTAVSSYKLWGSYKIEGGKLYVKEDSYSSYQAYDYLFYKNDSLIHLSTSSAYLSKTLAKTSNFVPSSNFKWEEINITMTGSGDISYDLINLDRSSVPYHGVNAPSEWGNVSVGDVVDFGDYNFDTYVNLKWIPYTEVISGAYFSGVDQSVPNGLVAYWDFDNISDSVLYDKTGNGNFGKIHGATYGPGVKGSALIFDGASNYVQFAGPVISAPPYSICAWVKPDHITDSQQQYIIANGGESSLYNGFYINVETQGMHHGDYSFGVTNGITEGHAAYHPSSPELAFLCGTWDGSTNVSNIKLYVNGNLVATGNSSFASKAPLNNLRIGCPSGQTHYILDGFIDEVRIYNRILNSTEIQEIYNTTFIKKTLYVGGVGDGNYSRIQDAIDNASYEDTVYVYSGVYAEHLWIVNSIHLLGEDRQNTIIDGSGYPIVINVRSEGVNVKGFTIQNSGGSKLDEGICDYSNNDCVFSDNIIENTGHFGVSISYSNNCIVFNNTISNITQCGISIGGGSSNIVTRNYIENSSSDGIWLEGSSYNNISENTITKCGRGILIRQSSVGNVIHLNNITNTKWEGIGMYSWPEHGQGSPEDNTIFQNNLENSGHYGEYAYLNNGYYGIYIENAYNNYIYCNNFINNIPNSQACDNSNNTFYNTSTLTGNYWDDYSGEDSDGDGVGETPYKIFCGYNQDPYPMINPYPQ